VTVASGLAATWALLFTFLLAEEETPPLHPETASLSPVRSPGPADSRLRFTWNFETTDPKGRELYPLEEVPLLLGERPTQPFWIQLFGNGADPLRRDRFPRRPAATLSSMSPGEGHRSLHIQSRGDCILVQLSSSIPVTGGVALRLSADVKLKGLREGGLQFRVFFAGEQLREQEARHAFPPLRGDRDWSRVKFNGLVPDDARFLKVEILLEGSFRDRVAQAWVDSMELEILPRLRIDWDREFLLFGTGEREISFQLEARGLEPGEYQLGVDLLGLHLDPGIPPESPRRFEAQRYVPAPAESVPSGKGNLTSSLRFRGDLRRMFPGPALHPGPYGLVFRLRRADRSGGGSPVDGGERTERIGLIRGATTEAETRAVLLGMVWKQSQILRGDLAVLAGFPAGFPLSGLLWDLAGEWKAGAPPELPPEVRLSGSRSQIPWSGRLGEDFLRDPGAPAIFGNWSPHIQGWEVAVDPESPLAAESLAKIRGRVEFISLGAQAGFTRPSWARFRVFEMAGAPGPGGEIPEIQDWAIVESPGEENEWDGFLTFCRTLLGLARDGYRNIYYRQAFDLLGQRSSDGNLSPRRAAFAWMGLGRWLARSPVLRDCKWDPRGLFLVLQDGRDHSLLVMARGKEPFSLRRWTGLPLHGEDLLENPVTCRFLKESGESEIQVRPEPVLYRGLDLNLLDTVYSLDLSGPPLKPGRKKQEIRFQVKNGSDQPGIFRLKMEMPRDWWVTGGGAARKVEPGGETTFQFPVEAPEGFQGDETVPVNLHLEIERNGRTYSYREARSLECSSKLIRLRDVRVDSASGKLRFILENRAGDTLDVQLYCRVLLGGKKDLLEFWDARLPPAGERSFTAPLRRPAEDLDGKEIQIGAKVRGRNEFLGRRYRLKGSGDSLLLLQ